MTTRSVTSNNSNKSDPVAGFNDFTQLADYSLVNSLKADPDAREDGTDHHSRQVYSGHFVPVTPRPIADPEYVSHSKNSNQKETSR